MITSRKTKGLRMVVAGMVCSILLLMLPLSAAAVDFAPLATIKRGLTYPTDMAVSPNGTIYVVDGIARKVLTYDNSYRYTGGFTSVEGPVAVAVSGTGTLYVSDNISKSVLILDPSSGLVTGYLKQDSAGTMATFKLPRNIAIGPDGTVYVVDQFNNSIEVFNSSNVYSYTITGLTKPQDVVATGTELFVIDQPIVSDENGTLNGSRLQIYDLAGRAFVMDANRAFPVFGSDTTNGQYISLKGISIDPHNNIYVSDSFLQVVYKYNTDGDFLGPISDNFATPLGMAVSADGRLFVTSSYDGMVRVLGVDAIAGADTWMNDAPVASAGQDQQVAEGASFTLDASGSSDNDGIENFQWIQTSGIPVLPANPYNTDSATLSLTAPDVGPEGALLIFDLIVTDTSAKQSAAASTRVNINNVISGSVSINDGALYATSAEVSLALDAPEAVDMRFANDGYPFDDTYYAFAPTGQWTLTSGDGPKTVNVEFRDAGGHTTLASSSIILDTQAPATPGIETGGTSGEFNWQPVEDSASYTLQYASNNDFTGAVTITGLDYNGLTIALDGLDSGTWFWRVQAVDAAGNASAWSDTGTFAVGPNCSGVPNAPQLALPYNNAGDISRTAILETNSMTYPAACGTHLRTVWQVSKSSGFDTLVMNVGTTMDNLTVYQVPALVLEPETTYFWRVKQIASNGKESDWSDSWAFTTVAVYDEKGVDGVLYVQPEGTADATGEEISIQERIGDSYVSIKAIRVSPGVVAQTIKDIDPNTIPDTVNKPAEFPLGLLSFRLSVEEGAAAQVEVVFNRSAPRDAEWYVYNTEDGWHVFEGAVFSRRMRSVTLNFQDGGLGDADGVANGIIVNP